MEQDGCLAKGMKQRKQSSDWGPRKSTTELPVKVNIEFPTFAQKVGQVARWLKEGRFKQENFSEIKVFPT